MFSKNLVVPSELIECIVSFLFGQIFEMYQLDVSDPKNFNSLKKYNFIIQISFKKTILLCKCLAQKDKPSNLKKN